MDLLSDPDRVVGSGLRLAVCYPYSHVSGVGPEAAHRGTFGRAARVEHENPNSGQVKIVIELPMEARVGTFTRETLWAAPEGGGLYRVFNVPFLAYNIHIGDLVRCAPDNPPSVEAVVERSGAQTFRVYFSETASSDQIKETLHMLLSRNCILEKANDRVYAVGMRSVADYEWAGPQLEQLRDDGVLELESGFQEDMPFAPPP